MTELRTCAHCGTAEEELTAFNGRLYCPDCLDDLTLVCTDCGSRFLRTHNRSENDDFPICPECYDRDYTRCVRCGRIIDTNHCWYPLDNDDPYCADCCSTIENSPIHDYYFKPYPIFYGDGPRYFGVELEIDDGGEYKSSEYTKTMKPALRKIKMQAATNLDEMLLLAENGEWRENVKPKHSKDAQNGWYRYDTQFAVPILNAKKAIDHYTVYGGTLLIRNDADGKSYLYDLLDVEKKKVISKTSFSAETHSEVTSPKPSDASILTDGENVKPKFSLKTYSEAEKKAM